MSNTQSKKPRTATVQGKVSSLSTKTQPERSVRIDAKHIISTNTQVKRSKAVKDRLKSARIKQAKADDETEFFYFDIDGRAEVARLAFILVGKHFEDVRITDEEFPDAKPTVPHENFPVLEVGGKKIAENVCLISYVADECGLHGRDKAEQLKIIEMIQVSEYVWSSVVSKCETRDVVGVSEQVLRIKIDIMPQYQSYLENSVKDGVKAGGYALGDKLTLADLLVFDLYTGYLKRYASCVEDFPCSRKIVEKLWENKKIKEWNEAETSL